MSDLPSNEPEPEPNSDPYAPPAEAQADYLPATPQPQPVYYPPARPTSTMAIVSLVLGIIAVSAMGCYGVPGLLFGIPAVITGRLGRAEVQRRQGELQGDGMALAGLIMGWIATAIGALAVLAIGALILIIALSED